MSSKGAEFRKTDLQIHSPRDLNWEGVRPEGATREEYCRLFIEKCVSEGLNAIAITDHHEGVYAYKIIETLEKLQAESIRQAMLAPDSRIFYEEPNLPSVIINSVTIRGSRYLADGKYSFNQLMNSIIGGRGAGKSTLLEYIRFALGRSAIDDTTSSSSATSRLREILEGTLDTLTKHQSVN